MRSDYRSRRILATVVAVGTFRVHPDQWRDTPGHCGLRPTEVRYRTEVTGYLDGRGFVLDVRESKAYFDKTYGDPSSGLPSCEMMAVKAARALWSKALAPTKVRVEIQASLHGFAVFEYRSTKGA